MSFGTGGCVDFLRQGVIDPNDKRSFGRGLGHDSPPPASYKERRHLRSDRAR
jgi:hypothetical protein